MVCLGGSASRSHHALGQQLVGVGEAGRNCACHRVASNLFEVEHHGASNIDGCQFTVVNHAVHMRRGDAEAIRTLLPKLRQTHGQIGYLVNNAQQKLLGYTAAQVAERAGISRPTLSKIEHGDPGVAAGSLLAVMRVLGLSEQLHRAIDPYETELGRASADRVLPERVRR